MSNRLDRYKFGGRPASSINLLLLIGEMEGVYQHLKYMGFKEDMDAIDTCLLYTSPSPRDKRQSRMPSSA